MKKILTTKSKLVFLMNFNKNSKNNNLLKLINQVLMFIVNNFDSFE